MSAISLDPNENRGGGLVTLQPGSNFRIFTSEYRIESDIRPEERDHISRIHIEEAPWDIGEELLSTVMEDSDLDDSLIQSLRGISRYVSIEGIHLADLVAYLDTHEEMEFEFPVIRLNTEISSLEQWERIEAEIGQIIEEAEVGDTTIYFNINPISG